MTRHVARGSGASSTSHDYNLSAQALTGVWAAFELLADFLRERCEFGGVDVCGLCLPQRFGPDGIELDGAAIDEVDHAGWAVSTHGAGAVDFEIDDRIVDVVVEGPGRGDHFSH